MAKSVSPQLSSTIRLPRKKVSVQLSPCTSDRQAEQVALQRIATSPQTISPHDILLLQRTAGNRAVTGLIQARLMVGPAGDRYEQEADRVAEQVMASQPVSASANPQTVCRQKQNEEEIQTSPLVQRQEDEEEIQTSSLVQRESDKGFWVGSWMESALSSSRGGGSPLPGETRAFMESRFGADFSGVRVHTGGEAVQLSREVQAQAFTHGNDIYFNEGKYNPETETGKQLLAHELAHTIQQGASRAVQRQPEEETPVTAQNGTSAAKTRAKEMWAKLKQPLQQENGVKEWMQQNLTGDKLVDTDKFPELNQDKALHYIRLKPGRRQALKQHIMDKLTTWIPNKTNREIFFRKLMRSDKAQRNKMLSEAYLAHIEKVASKGKGTVSKDQLRALAIYSSSEYTPMNKLGRGLGEEAKPEHLWFLAKANVGLKKAGKAGQPANQTRTLRRDTQLSPDLLKKAILDPWAGDKIYQDLGFLSSTTVHEGVPPFNENSNVAFIITMPSEAAAMNISELSAYPKESEVLFQSGARFLITLVEDKRPEDLKSGKTGTKDGKVWVYMTWMPRDVRP